MILINALYAHTSVLGYKISMRLGNTFAEKQTFSLVRHSRVL